MLGTVIGVRGIALQGWVLACPLASGDKNKRPKVNVPKRSQQLSLKLKTPAPINIRFFSSKKLFILILS
jgi:hypothetical protein